MFIAVLANACQNEQEEDYQYYKFSRQVSPSGQYVIYNYARFGSMAFSSDIAGTELFKIEDEFKEGKGQNINGSISQWLSNDTLLVYNFNSDLEKPKDTLPIKTDFRELGDFTVKTVYYKSNSGGRTILKIDSVGTTSDSIFIRTISQNESRKVLGFPLGGISVRTIADSIVRLTIQNRLTKNMNFVYKNTDGTFTSGLPGIGTTEYEMTPTRKISPKELIQRKIFWEIEE